MPDDLLRDLYYDLIVGAFAARLRAELEKLVLQMALSCSIKEEPEQRKWYKLFEVPECGGCILAPAAAAAAPMFVLDEHIKAFSVLYAPFVLDKYCTRIPVLDDDYSDLFQPEDDLPVTGPTWSYELIGDYWVPAPAGRYVFFRGLCHSNGIWYVDPGSLRITKEG